MEPLEYRTNSSDYAQAFKSVRFAKNVCWWLLAFAILVQLVCFCLVRFAGVIDAAPQLVSPEQATAVVTYEENAINRARQWHTMLHWVLPGTKFLAVVSSMLLILILLFGVKLSLLGRLGGLAGLISAFFWSLILFAMVIPWQQVLKGSFVSGSVYNLGNLVQETRKVLGTWGATDVSWLDHVVYYARFILFPLVTVAVWLLVQLKFARGYRQMTMPPAVTTAGSPPTDPLA